MPARVMLLVASRLAVLLVLVGAPLAAAAERGVVVSVLDQKDQPVEGLTPQDFVVREDGAAREVLRVARASEAMQIALLIDDSQAATSATRDIRDAAKAFVRLLGGTNEIAVITFGERPTLRSDYSSDPAAAMRAIDRIFPRSASGMYMMDAVVDAAKGLAKREPSVVSGLSRTARDPWPPRRHIVLVMTEGIEFSTRSYQDVVDAVHRAGAVLHALVLTSASAADVTNDDIRNRNQVLDLGTRTTGGRRDNLLAESSFEQAMTSLARELTSQYRVVYARPDSLIPPEQLDVRVQRPGLTVRAPTRAER
jgi:VWFA-related protein